MFHKLTLKNALAEKRHFSARIVLVSLIVLGLSSLLVWRYFSLQIIAHDTYRTKSDQNRTHLQAITPKRGLIFDRNGVLLAENIPSYRLTIVKEQAGDLAQTLALLSELIPLQDNHLQAFQHYANRSRPFEPVPLKLKLSEEEIAIIAVNRHRLPGVDIDAELVRHYPHGTLFAHAIGYVGHINETELQQLDPVNYRGTHVMGKIGIEKYYEDLLHGKVGYQNVETNARGRILTTLEQQDPQPGADISLHLDVHLQNAAFQALGDYRGAIVALDPNTGSVLAAVSKPSFDSNQFIGGISNAHYDTLRDSPDLPLFDRVLQGQYPPASTIKPIFGLAGLHYGTITASDTINDPGWYQLPNSTHIYRDWKRTGHGHRVNLRQAIVESCDVYYYDLAYRLGIDRLHTFASYFGLGEPTGIDNTYERRGLMPSKTWKRQVRQQAWFSGDTVNIGIGQGYLLVTPLQLATTTATIASRGKRFQPRLLKTVDGEEQPLAPLPAIDVDVSSAHWDAVINGMRDVVHGRHGTARSISRGIQYQMAGKTGIAQLVGIEQDATYDAKAIALRQRDHALFIGFAPLQDPQIVVAVIVENGEYGSTVAAPMARQVIDAYLLTDENKT